LEQLSSTHSSSKQLLHGVNASYITRLKPWVQDSGLIFVKDLNDSLAMQNSSVIFINHSSNNEIFDIPDSWEVIDV